MLLDIASASLPVLLGFYLVFTKFYAYYSSEPLLAAPLFALCALSALLIALPSHEKFNPRYFLLSLIFPFALCVCAAYNFIYLPPVLLFSVLYALLFRKGRVRSRIEFVEGDLFVVNTRRKRTFKDVYVSACGIFMILTLVLFILTLSFTRPTRFWLSRLFPVDLRDYRLQSEEAVPCGNVTAACWYSDEALLVGDFFDVSSSPSPCREAGLLKGDIITAIDGGSPLSSSLVKDGATGAAVEITVLRPESGKSYIEKTFTVKPVFSEEDDAYRIGLSYYTGASLGASVQTLSFAFPESCRFAATAHSSDSTVSSVSTGGALFPVRVTGRDADGLTVELSDSETGRIDFSDIYGSFGTLNSVKGSPLPIAKKRELRRGKAVMLSDFEGEVYEYEVFITGTYRIEGRDVITLIADDKRLRAFGGVARGMSGSPIIQNGKIIGALSNMDDDGVSAYATFACDMAHELDILFAESEEDA